VTVSVLSGVRVEIRPRRPGSNSRPAPSRFDAEWLKGPKIEPDFDRTWKDEHGILVVRFEDVFSNPVRQHGALSEAILETT
jgi:hypothetical protein